jgi:type II secretory pathway predicted ATPase ExeA
MYNQFYGFSENPFNVTPDPRFLYLTPSHREALASMVYGINDRKGFISITGEVGTGKTTLIYTLLQQLGEKVKTVFIFHTNITFEELLKNILLEIELPIVEEGKTSLLHLINEYLIQKLSQDETLAIIIDEAQNLSKEVLEEFRMLSNLETPKSKLLQIVLVGQPELEIKLDSTELRQLKQRIGIRRQIKPLNLEESRKYIDYRLNLVGSSSSKLFSSKAISLISDYGKGIPRTINMLCDNALLIGYSLSRKKIAEDIIREVIQDMEASVIATLPQSPNQNKGASPLLQNNEASLKLKPFEERPRTIYSKASFFILLFLCVGLLFLLGKEYLQKGPIKKEERRVPQNLLTEATPSPKEIPPEIQKESISMGNTQLSHIKPPPLESDLLKDKNKVENFIYAKKEDCLLSLARKYYQKTNETLIDFLLESNPEITNIHLIKINQKIKLPEIKEESLILESSDHIFKIRIGTFPTLSQTRLYKDELVLKGKEIEIIPRKVSPQETWYQVVAGQYNTKEECLKTIAILKEKNLLPLGDNL